MDKSRRKRVLVVDDNQDAADTLAMLLEAEGCECRATYDGASALAAAEATAPDVVILDLFMPRMSGDEVARALRARPCGRGMTLVAHTAMSSQPYQDTISAAGFDHHLVKPASVEQLLAAVGAPQVSAERVPTPAAWAATSAALGPLAA